MTLPFLLPFPLSLGAESQILLDGGRQGTLVQVVLLETGGQERPDLGVRKMEHEFVGPGLPG